MLSELPFKNGVPDLEPNHNSFADFLFKSAKFIDTVFKTENYEHTAKFRLLSFLLNHKIIGPLHITMIEKYGICALSNLHFVAYKSLLIYYYPKVVYNDLSEQFMVAQTYPSFWDATAYGILNNANIRFNPTYAEFIKDACESNSDKSIRIQLLLTTWSLHETHDEYQKIKELIISDWNNDTHQEIQDILLIHKLREDHV